jgi:hypothetical protein
MPLLLLLSLMTLPPVQTPAAAPLSLDWATLAVEREAFFEDKPGEYGTKGQFDGVGMLYISVSRKTLLYRGLRRIPTPRVGQQKDDEFEFHQESFTLQSGSITTAGEYTFTGVNDGPSGRTVSGTLRFSVAGNATAGTATEFRLDEQGQTIKGVLNRYTLAKSPPASSMLRKFDSVFFGGNVVALSEVK